MRLARLLAGNDFADQESLKLARNLSETCGLNSELMKLLWQKVFFLNTKHPLTSIFVRHLVTWARQVSGCTVVGS